MKHRTTSFYVEVKEEDGVKVVPHTPKEKWYKFMNRADAKKYLEKLRKSNPESKFRLVIETVEVTHGAWD